MAKTKKTARELAAMVMREVRASGKCSDLQSVVVHPTGRNYPTWECATQVNKADNPEYQLSAACRHTLDLIVGRLQSIYDGRVMSSTDRQAPDAALQPASRMTVTTAE
jgi:hypothetical protein